MPISTRQHSRRVRSADRSAGFTGTIKTTSITTSNSTIGNAARPSHRPVRGHQDLSAALGALRVRHGLLDLLDGIDRLDGRREDALRDLLAEVGVDRSDLLERSCAQGSAEDEADER